MISNDYKCTKPNLKKPMLQLSAYWGEIHTHPNNGDTQFNVLSRTDADYIGTKNALMLTQSDGLKSFDLDAANRISTEQGCFENMYLENYNLNFGNLITCPTNFNNYHFSPTQNYLFFYDF